MPFALRKKRKEKKKGRGRKKKRRKHHHLKLVFLLVSCISVRWDTFEISEKKDEKNTFS